MNKIITDFMQIGKSDLIKGAIMAAMGSIITAIVVILQGIIAVPPVYPNTHMIVSAVIAGIISGATYLLKNLLTNSKDQFLKKEPEDQKK